MFSNVTSVILSIFLSIIFYSENIFADSAINNVRQFLNGQQKFLKAGPLSYSANHVKFESEAKTIEMPITHLQHSDRGVYILARSSLYEEISVFYSEDGSISGTIKIDKQEFLVNSPDGSSYQISIKPPPAPNLKDCDLSHIKLEDPILHNPVEEKNVHIAPSAVAEKNVTSNSTSNSNTNIVDVAVFYTNDAFSSTSYRGESFILNQFERANIGLSDSNANEQYNVVHIQEIDPVTKAGEPGVPYIESLIRVQEQERWLC